VRLTPGTRLRNWGSVTPWSQRSRDSPLKRPSSSRYSSRPTPLGSRKYRLSSTPRSGPKVLQAGLVEPAWPSRPARPAGTRGSPGRSGSSPRRRGRSGRHGGPGRRRRRPVGDWAQVALPEPLATSPDLLQFCSLGLRHRVVLPPVGADAAPEGGADRVIVWDLRVPCAGDTSQYKLSHRNGPGPVNGFPRLTGPRSDEAAMARSASSRAPMPGQYPWTRSLPTGDAASPRRPAPKVRPTRRSSDCETVPSPPSRGVRRTRRPAAKHRHGGLDVGSADRQVRELVGRIVRRKRALGVRGPGRVRADEGGEQVGDRRSIDDGLLGNPTQCYRSGRACTPVRSSFATETLAGPRCTLLLA
jgi:hypothetical protein